VNAYADERFNKDIDKHLGYTTRTILGVPILDENNKCLGVIQCINKITASHFTKEDEGLLGMIADFARIVL
jgi:GAF domain-containing protein